MKKFKRWTLLATLLLSFAFADGASQHSIIADESIIQTLGKIVFTPESKVWFNGNSTLHPFSATATKVSYTLKMKDDGTPIKKSDDARTVLSNLIKNKRIGQFKVDISAESLKSHDKGLDDNMYRAMKTDKYPSIVFELNDYDLLATDGTDTLNVRVKGDLTIAGTKKKITLDTDVTIQKDGLVISGNKTFKMSEYGIDPPVIMFIISVSDPVDVRFNIKAKFK